MWPECGINIYILLVYIACLGKYILTSIPLSIHHHEFFCISSCQPHSESHLWRDYAQMELDQACSSVDTIPQKHAHIQEVQWKSLAHCCSHPSPVQWNQAWLQWYKLIWSKSCIWHTQIIKSHVTKHGTMCWPQTCIYAMQLSSSAAWPTMTYGMAHGKKKQSITHGWSMYHMDNKITHWSLQCIYIHKVMGACMSQQNCTWLHIFSTQPWELNDIAIQFAFKKMCAFGFVTKLEWISNKLINV